MQGIPKRESAPKAKRNKVRNLTLDSEVQTRFKARVEGPLNGIFLKIILANHVGFPDAICFFLGGKVVLVELKRVDGGGKATDLSGGQRTFSRVLRAMGFRVEVITTLEEVDAFEA